jgi:hypothetical protein
LREQGKTLRAIADALTADGQRVSYVTVKAILASQDRAG